MTVSFRQLMQIAQKQFLLLFFLALGKQLPAMPV
jgi:hypothetical protein